MKENEDVLKGIDINTVAKRSLNLRSPAYVILEYAVPDVEYAWQQLHPLEDMTPKVRKAIKDAVREEVIKRFSYSRSASANDPTQGEETK